MLNPYWTELSGGDALYKTFSIVEPVGEMIRACPFLGEYQVEAGIMGYEDFPKEQGIPEQALIDMSGSDQAGEICTIDGENAVIFTRVISFMFLEDKYPEDNSVVDFRTNFIEWVAWLNETGDAPRFSHRRMRDGSTMPYMWLKERMWATNALYIGKTDSGANTYNVDVQVRYVVKYESDGRCY